MSEYLSLSDADLFVRKTRREFDALAAELAGIPARLNAAKAAGDSEEIRKIKAREIELHGLILDEAGRARKAIADQRDSERIPRNDERDALTEASAAASTALAELEADCAARLAAAREAVRLAELAVTQFEIEGQRTTTEYVEAEATLRAAIAASADYV